MRLHDALDVVGVAGMTMAFMLALFKPCSIGSADEGKGAAAKLSVPAETLEAVAARLKKAVGIDWPVSKSAAGFGSRRHIEVNLRTWYNTVVPYMVTPASPADQVGDRPADYNGAFAVEVIATDGRYSVVAGPSYEPEIAAKILAALGMTLSKEAEQHRLMYSAADWLDFRLAVARPLSREHQTLQPLAQGPSLEQIDDYAKLFAEKGPNGGRHRGDPYLWFQVLDCCEVSPLLLTKDVRDVLPLHIHPTTYRADSYVLLSDKLDEVLLNRSERPRPWHLNRVQATRDVQGRSGVELAFDEVAAARMARLTKANPGRALAILFDNQVVQIQVIDGELRDKMVLSGKAFDEKLVARILRSLRECMVAQDASDRLSSQELG